MASISNAENSSVVMVYTTTSNEDEARHIGKILVERRLVACVNIISNMSSVYWWKGVVEEDNECIMIAKTTKDRIDEITAAIKDIHSYELPCIVVLPIISGLEPYLDWLIDETHQ